MGLGNLVSTIKNGYNAVRGLLGDDELLLYPKAELKNNLQSNLNVENWCKSLGYSFAVVDTSATTTSYNEKFQEFELPINPTDITQEEEPAINIRPTQGGTVISHSGNRYKNLRISGTTGINPYRGSGGVDKSNGKSIFSPNELKYRSGYEVFIELRNYFKAYYQYKYNNPGVNSASNSCLIFKNYKDGEFLIVEVLKFTMKRSASKPMMYDYEIDLKVLRHFEFTDSNQNEPWDQALRFYNSAMNKIDTAKKTLLKLSSIIKEIESGYQTTLMEPLQKINSTVKSFFGVTMDISDFPKNILKTTMNAASAYATLLNVGKYLKTMKNEEANSRNARNKSSSLTLSNSSNPTTRSKNATIASTEIPSDTEIKTLVETQGIDAFDAFKDSIALVGADALPEKTQTTFRNNIQENNYLTKKNLENTLSNILRTKYNAEDKFNMGSELYDSLFDRITTFKAETIKTPTNDELDLLSALSQAADGIVLLLRVQREAKLTLDKRLLSIIQYFDPQELRLQTNSACQQITLGANISLEDLAYLYLGNSERWVEIAEINQLKAPYITQDIKSTTKGVLKPGDKIIIPNVNIFGFSSLPEGKENSITEDLSVVEKNLGIDLKLNDNFDLVISNNGDLGVISSYDNIIQAIITKLSIERGELKHAPRIGAGFNVGSKIQTLQNYKDEIIQTLLQDSRISSIQDLTIRQDGSALYINFNVFLKNIDIPIPISLPLD